MKSPQRDIIAIGGIGGSGTRLVASIGMKLGFYMGASLNHALDNLWFTLLFQRPGWFARFPDDDDIAEALRLFRRAMTTGLSGSMSSREASLIRGLVHDIEQAALKTGADRKTAEALIASMPPQSAASAGWGWKEPNSHIFLPQIAAEFDNLKYIFVIRNGLDMAFSDNTNQIRNWGKYICEISIVDEFLNEITMLDYWICANKRAIDIGTNILNNRFLVLNYDKICQKKSTELQKLVDFLKIDSKSNIINNFLSAIKITSIGRYKMHDISIFSNQQIETVREFGFDVDVTMK